MFFISTFFRSHDVVFCCTLPRFEKIFVKGFPYGLSTYTIKEAFARWEACINSWALMHCKHLFSLSFFLVLYLGCNFSAARARAVRSGVMIKRATRRGRNRHHESEAGCSPTREAPEGPTARGRRGKNGCSCVNILEMWS